jgi:hypothetical protein
MSQASAALPSAELPTPVIEAQVGLVSAARHQSTNEQKSSKRLTNGAKAASTTRMAPSGFDPAARFAAAPWLFMSASKAPTS